MWRKLNIPKLSKPAKWSLVVLTLLILSASTYYAVHATKILMPGETSAMAPKNTPLNGYISHSEFEKDCTHCHAPIHCVTDTKCQDCHADVAKQRAELDGLHGKMPGTEKCQNCHPEHNGNEVVITDFAFTNVDHGQMAGFNLEYHQVDYQGKPMNCQSCHSQERFSEKTLDCLTCHIEADHAMMSEHVDVYGVDCTRCHNGADRLKDFDHQLVHALEGAHTEVNCADCHNKHIAAADISGCSSCHADPELHAGQFGSDCARCHTATAWQPALLTKHVFVLDHGGTEISECHTCHSESFAVKTCYNCHDHQPAQMEQAHLAEGLIEIDNCAQCHPTGVSGEAAQILQTYGDFSLMPGFEAQQEQSLSPEARQTLAGQFTGAAKSKPVHINPFQVVNQEKINFMGK